MANLNETIDSSKKSLDGISNTVDTAKSKVQEYEASWEKVGSTANTSLSLLSAGLSKTNPAISSAVGSIQKIIPNLVEVGNAAKKTGSLIKGAFSSAGVLLAITVVAEVITSIITAHNKAEQAAKDHAKAEKDAARESYKAWKDFEEEINSIIYGQEYAAKLRAEEQIASVGGTDYYNKFVAPIVDSYKKGELTLEEANKQFKNQLVGLNEDTANSYKTLFKQGIQSYADYLNGLKNNSKDFDEEVVDPVLERLYELAKLSKDYVRDSALQQVASDIKIVRDQINSMSDQDPKKNYWVQVLNELRTQALELTGGVLPKVSNGLDELRQASTNTAGIVKNDLSGMTNETKIWKDGSIDAFDHLKKNATEYLDAAANLTDGLAQLLESDEKSAKKNAKKIKGLKIATATMDMLSGAIKAFTSAQELGPIAGPIVGGINAAAVVAMGIANINKIKNTNTESGSSSTPNVSTPTPSVSQSYISNSGYQESVDAAKATAQNTSQSNVVPVLVVDDVNKVQKDMTVVQTNSSF